MESSIGHMSCTLKVKASCDGCKREVLLELVQSVKGEYSVVIDSEQGTVKGEANPARILKLLDKHRKHGKVSKLRFDGEVMEQHPYYNRQYVYHLSCPQYDHHFGGFDYHPYLMPPPPPLMMPMHGFMPPPWSMFHDMSTSDPPHLSAKAPTPAPPPEQPRCCTIM